MRRHKLYQFGSITTFKRLPHQAVKWHLYSNVVITSVISFILSMLYIFMVQLSSWYHRSLHLTHSVMITFVDCISFTWLLRNPLICGLNWSTQSQMSGIIVQVPQSSCKLLPVLPSVPEVINQLHYHCACLVYCSSLLNNPYLHTFNLFFYIVYEAIKEFV